MIMNGKLTTRFFAGLFLLAGSFVLAYIILFFYARAQVAPLMRSGPSATDFAAPYFFVINRGALVGLLMALGMLGYWSIRFHLSADAAQRWDYQQSVIHFSLLLMPVFVAVLVALALALYLQQTEGAFSRYDRFLQP